MGMAKQAHITSDPKVEVGNRALALCGKEFKVKVLWEDIPSDKRICRWCVDVALLAMTDADALITMTRIRTQLVLERMTRLAEELLPEGFQLDLISQEQEDFAQRQARRAEGKALEEKAKHTCICTWELVEGGTRITAVDENCPIHGHSSGGTGYDVPVAPDEITQKQAEEEAEEFVKGFVQKADDNEGDENDERSED
jgi:hypothetical protein